MKLEETLKELRDRTAELVVPGFSYYEQELIRRVIKAIIPQLKSKRDKSVANDILRKTEWLDV
jgi:hypothetical protein